MRAKAQSIKPTTAHETEFSVAYADVRTLVVQQANEDH